MFKRKTFSLLLFLAVIILTTGFLPQTSYAAATIQNYPIPSIYTASSVFSLKADSTSVPVISFEQKYDYAEFSFSGTVTIEVTASENITSYSISPLAKNITGTVNGNKLTFTLSSSTYVVVEINNLKKLVIAADPLETDIPASSGTGIYNVTSSPYNADSTGATMATTAIQNAIDDANNAGGGIVYVPAGVYKCGNLTLKSNVTFYLAGGSVIVGTGNGADYSVDFNKSSISDGTYFIRTAIDSSNITIRGRGTIDGKGMDMRYNTKFINNLLVPMQTTNFTFDGVILRDGGFWAFMPVRSDNVTITNYKGFQRFGHLEADAIDINESQNVLVKHSIAISEDDAFSTKTWPQKGMSQDWPGAIEHLENVVFDDCLAWSQCVAFKMGMGICTPQIDVTIRNSYVYQSARALLVDHGYTANTLPEEGWARNITFENIDIEGVGINQFGNYWFGVSTSTSGDISNVLFKNINVRETGSQKSRLSGNITKGGMINGVTFTDIYVGGKLATNLTDLNASVVNDNVSSVVIANSPPTLFSDNFEDGDTTGWTVATGTWNVVTDSTNVLAQKANYTTGLITAGDSWTDYIAEAKMRIPMTNANAGLLFRVIDADNYYMYRINGTGKKLELYKCVNGTLTSVSSTSFTAVSNQWYTVKVIVKGNMIKAYVDGELKTEWTNPATELTAGKIGFRTTTLSAAFDDVVVSPINEVPTDIILSNNLVAENTTAGGIVGTFTTTDPDEQDTFAYSLVSGVGDTDNGSFSIAPLGNTLILRGKPDYETKNSYSIRVRSTDSGGLYYEKNLTINIVDVDETPTNSNSNAILLSDNFEDGNSAGWTSASGSWSVVTDDTKTLKQSASATSLITAGDSWTDYTYEAKMKMPITNANAGIVFRVKDSNNYYMYRINSAASKLELYKCVDGTMTSLSTTPFTAVAKQWYTVKVVMQENNIKCYVDGELKTEWTNPTTELAAGKIGFRTTSSGVLYDNVLVTEINKAPTDISLTNNSVVENTASGSSVGTFSSTDSDEADTFTYTLVTGNGDTDNGSFAISGNTLQTVSEFVYETKNSYSIRVRSTDANGLYFEKQFTITIIKTDVNKANALNNTVTLDHSIVASGATVAVIAMGDRQSANGSATGDEKYIPTTWTSTETGKNGSFIWNAGEGAYTSSYAASEAGTHTVTATFQKQTWDGSVWVSGATDTKTVTLQVYTPTNTAGNSLNISPSSIVVGQTVTITAEGNRQSITPTIIGDERYLPISWNSTEAGKSGVFTVSGQVYQSSYTPAAAGVYTITATYQKQVWDGASWVNGITDTNTATLTVTLAPTANAANNTLALNLSSVNEGGTLTITVAGDRQNAVGTVLGEERYFPTTWSSTENGKSGIFTVSGQVYSSSYTATIAGSYSITAAFQKQSWNGTKWINGTTDTKTISLTVNAVSTDDSSDSDDSNGETPSSPATGNTDADILINGKTENAGKVTTTQEGDKTVTTVSLDQSKLEQKLSQEGNGTIVTIPINSKSDVVAGELTGQMVKIMETKEAVLQIKTENVTYTLPAAQINIDAVSEQIGAQVALQDIKVSLTVATPSADTVKLVQDTANKNSYQIVVKPVEFDITCTSGSKTVDVSKFNSYVERTIAIPDGIDPSKITTGIVLNADGTFSHVPTTITKNDGKYYAKIKSLTNSTYSVIYSQKTFADVNTHWAKDAVNDMGSRLIIAGSGDGRFEPDRDITRAEFAAIIVKGLGLMHPGTGKDIFGDVTKDSWYYDAVAIAYEYGIIDGYGNGSFGPEDKITREQAMTMTARAMKLTGLKVEFKENEAEKLLSGFEDASNSSDYAKNSIASCIKTGIITGRDGNLVAPESNITRAEVAVIVRRLLIKSGLI